MQLNTQCYECVAVSKVMLKIWACAQFLLSSPSPPPPVRCFSVKRVVFTDYELTCGYTITSAVFNSTLIADNEVV